MVERRKSEETVCLEYAKAYPLLSLLLNKGDKTTVIDALLALCP
jgi:hypothetical protein